MRIAQISCSWKRRESSSIQLKKKAKLLQAEGKNVLLEVRELFYLDWLTIQQYQ